jgi:hypothetical protein
MAAPRIPTWQERLKACFRYRHRLLQVFGVPGALGAAAAVAGASALNPDTGLALGALTAAVGTLVAGYYVVAGFDHGVVDLLQAEESDQARQQAENDLGLVLASTDPELRAQLERILSLHSNLDGVFSDGIDDAVEAILQNSRQDLNSLRNRAVAMVKLFQRLTLIVQQSNGQWLEHEVRRMDAELVHTPEGALRDTRVAARESTARALGQWQAACQKQAQVRSILTLIENNLQEFKLAMELRKADAAMGAEASAPQVSELQARLAAAGEACDELIGRTSSVAPRPRRSQRTR